MLKVLALAGTLVLATAGGAAAGGVNLITNGTFADNSLYQGGGVSESFRYAIDNGASYPNSTLLPGWTYYVGGGLDQNNQGLASVLSTSNLDSSYNMIDTCCQLGFWGASDGGVSPITAPPSGDAFVLAQDGAAENAAYVSQTITGLDVGKTYQVTFEFAALQLYGFGGTQWNGATNAGVTVNLGGNYDTSAPGGASSQAWIGGQTDTWTYMNYTDAVPSHGFTGWLPVTMTFTATSTSEVLSLESISTSSGEPPFALIDNVQMFQVPEPATWLLMIVGFGGLGAVARHRRAKASTGAA